MSIIKELLKEACDMCSFKDSCCDDGMCTTCIMCNPSLKIEYYKQKNACHICYGSGSVSNFQTDKRHNNISVTRKCNVCGGIGIFKIY